MPSVNREIAAAYRAGAATWNHAPRGVDVPNPYDGRGDTARERVLSVAWRRGRLSGVSPAFRGADLRGDA